MFTLKSATVRSHGGTVRRRVIVDWGTTNFRAYLVDDAGTCLDRVANNEGLLEINDNFQCALEKNIGHWLIAAESVPVILSGMVGSRNGWIELPYVSCPLTTEKLANVVHQVESFNNGQCWIIPGVSATAVSGCFDVMRGEEIQFLGARHLIEKSQFTPPDVICLPGTHNK